MRLTTRGTSLGVAVMLLNGCSAGWSQVPVAPAALESEPTEVRATMADGSRIVLAVPRIERDTLFGEVHGAPRAMAMADVRRLALPVASTSKRSAGTVAVLTAIGMVVAGWTVLNLAAQ